MNPWLLDGDLMRKKLMSSLVLASAIAGISSLPSHADDDMFKSVMNFPWKVAGSVVGTAVGVPEGMLKDSVKGAMKSTQWAAGKLGDEKGACEQSIAGVVVGPFGFVGGGAYGVFDGALHGMKVGYDKPFSKEAFTFKDE
jgi:hypothetical protein